jgi:hypothetical protein
MSQELIQFVLTVLNQVKLLHWATTNYAAHQALGALHDTLQEQFDKLIESFIGAKHLQPLESFSIRTNISSVLDNNIVYLQNVINECNYYRQQYERLMFFQNIIDDIVGHINQTIYLLNLQ